MRLPVIEGLIRRRLLVNFRVDPAAMRRLLPEPFEPKLHRGNAIAGICLIRLEQIRPVGFPAGLGFSSENAAHRIAVTWTDPECNLREGVFIPRRDTGSRLNHLAGGRIFPGEHHLADFEVEDSDGRIDLDLRSKDGQVTVRLRGSEATALPASSSFPSLGESSAFFEGGSLGYSVTRDPRRLDGLRLSIRDWQVRPIAIDQVESSFFANQARFPAGSVEFDHALIMRDVPHQWHQDKDLLATPRV
jgi:hypothetical protein